MKRIVADVLREVAAVDAARGDDAGTTWGTGGEWWGHYAAAARTEYDGGERAGVPTLALALREELYEALAESDPVKLRTELVQISSLSMRWIRAIDGRR